MATQAKVYRNQGSSDLIVASGGSVRFQAGAALALSTNVAISGLADNLPGQLASGTVPLGAFLFAARQLASAETLSTGVGAIITASADAPQLALSSSGDQSFYLSYASAIVAGIKLPPIALPTNLATAPGFQVDLYGETVGTASAADAVQAFDIRCWMGVGDTEMGSTHPNFTTTPGWQGITVASGDIVAGAPLNITLVPQAHALRAIRLYDARLRYKLTS